MAKKEYTVTGPFPVLDHDPGKAFKAEIEPEHEAYLLKQGLLKRGGTSADGEDAAPEKVPCPACVEYGLKQPPKFDDLGALQDHYAEKHPALVAPTELPAPGEED